MVLKFDDLYVTNSLGALGSSRVVMLNPSADTAQKDFTNSIGDGTNFNKVNSQLADSSDYIYATAAGAKDMYEMDDLPYNPVKIHGVQPVFSGRKDQLNPKSVTLNVDSSGTVVNGNDYDLIESDSDFKLYLDAIIEQDPSTTADWTTSGVNSLKMGPEIL